MDSNSQNNIPILKVKKCRWCNFYFLTEVPNKLYCCDLHRERANRNNKKLWARQHREVHGLPENHNEVSKEAMERYREHWVNHFTFDKNNKSEQLGGGRLSKKRNADFEIEKKLIKWEKRRLGIK